MLDQTGKASPAQPVLDIDRVNGDDAPPLFSATSGGASRPEAGALSNGAWESGAVPGGGGPRYTLPLPANEHSDQLVQTERGGFGSRFCVRMNEPDEVDGRRASMGGVIEGRRPLG